MSLGACATCKTLQHFSDRTCAKCGALLEWATVGMSAQPCGCDFGMTPPHRCEEHQREYEDMIEEALRMNF